MAELGDIMENLPYILPRSASSVIKRYIAAHEDEIDTFEQRLDEVVDSHQIDNATGDELDELGAMFGVLGKRRGRDDNEYRIYLKSIVQAFSGRGTVPGIIAAVAAGLGVDEDEIDITEDFQNIEYDVIISEWPDHKGSTVEELADLADASVAQLNKTIYDVDEDEMAVDDGLSITEGQQYSDEIAADDAVAIDPNKYTFGDEAAADDTVDAITTQTITWGDDWDTMHWAVEHN